MPTVQFTPACRNTMAKDSFYGSTWKGIFQACRVGYTLSGPFVANTAANLAGNSTVATAANSGTAASAANDPLLSAAAPSVSQAAPGGAALAVLPLMAAVAAAATLLL